MTLVAVRHATDGDDTEKTRPTHEARGAQVVGPTETRCESARRHNTTVLPVSSRPCRTRVTRAGDE
jgi:hypothetical protein